MRLMVSNEAERSPKLELQKLNGLREGWNSTAGLNHAWEKAQCRRHGIEKSKDMEELEGQIEKAKDQVRIRRSLM